MIYEIKFKPLQNSACTKSQPKFKVLSKTTITYSNSRLVHIMIKQHTSVVSLRLTKKDFLTKACMARHFDTAYHKQLEFVTKACL